MSIIEIVISMFVAIFASTGFWAFVTVIYQKRDASKNARDKILMGLARRQILLDAEVHLMRGYITPDDYQNLNEYLYKPYKALGGNGSAERVMNEVEKLPHKEVY